MESVFYFVSDKTLKKQLAESLNFSLNLESLAKDHQEPMRSVFYKTIVVYMASIIEAVLYFCILQLGFTHYRKDWIYKDIKLLYQVDENNQVVAGKRVKKKARMKGYMDFGILNQFCKKQAKLYKEDVYKKVDKCRGLRNKIHLMKVSEWDEEFNNKTVESVAKTLLRVLKIVEKKLKPKNNAQTK